MPTDKLISDPLLAALVNELAQKSRIESARIGESGAPSQTHALFMRVAEAARPEQAVALLGYASAVVRGYFAERVLETLPNQMDQTDLVAAVYPLLADATEVEETSGCCISETPVSLMVLMALRARLDQPAVQELLLRAAQDPHSDRCAMPASSPCCASSPKTAMTMCASSLAQATRARHSASSA